MKRMMRRLIHRCNYTLQATFDVYVVNTYQVVCVSFVLLLQATNVASSILHKLNLYGEGFLWFVPFIIGSIDRGRNENRLDVFVLKAERRGRRRFSYLIFLAIAKKL